MILFALDSQGPGIGCRPALPSRFAIGHGTPDSDGGRYPRLATAKSALPATFSGALGLEQTAIPRDTNTCS
jgi:hypothetical protein